MGRNVRKQCLARRASNFYVSSSCGAGAAALSGSRPGNVSWHWQQKYNFVGVLPSPSFPRLRQQMPSPNVVIWPAVTKRVWPVARSIFDLRCSYYFRKISFLFLYAFLVRHAPSALVCLTLYAARTLPRF